MRAIVYPSFTQFYYLYICTTLSEWVGVVSAAPIFWEKFLTGCLQIDCSILGEHHMYSSKGLRFFSLTTPNRAYRTLLTRVLSKPQQTVSIHPSAHMGCISTLCSIWKALVNTNFQFKHIHLCMLLKYWHYWNTCWLRLLGKTLLRFGSLPYSSVESAFSQISFCFHKLKFLSFPLCLISFLHKIHSINLPTLMFLFS